MTRMERSKKEALEQLATGIFRLLTIIAVIMFGIATVGVITTGSDVFLLSTLPQWIKFCLIPSLVWIFVLLLWCVVCAFYIVEPTREEAMETVKQMYDLMGWK